MSADQIPVFEPGDHFVTRDELSETRLWFVDVRGLAKIVSWGDLDQPADRELLSVSDVAHALSKSTRTIWGWIGSGKIISVKDNGHRRIPRSELDRLRGAL